MIRICEERFESAEVILTEAQGDLDTAVQSVKAEYEEMAAKHDALAPEFFNNDKEYKQLTTEAIESKSLALEKLSVIIRLAADGVGADVLRRAVERRMADFAHEGTVLELRTGVSGFPWAEAGKAAAVALGAWTPSGLDAPQLGAVAAALAGNSDLRSLSIQGATDTLVLKNGWATADIDWDSNAAVRASPGVTGFVLRCCTGLRSLSLRSAPRAGPNRITETTQRTA